MTNSNRTKYFGVTERYRQELEGRSEAMDRAAVFAWKRDNFEAGAEIAGYDKMAELWFWCFEGRPTWGQIWRNVQEVDHALKMAAGVN